MREEPRPNVVLGGEYLAGAVFHKSPWFEDRWVDHLTPTLRRFTRPQLKYTSTYTYATNLTLMTSNQTAPRYDAFSPTNDIANRSSDVKLLNILAGVPTSERANVWSHGVAALLFLLGGTYLFFLSGALASVPVTAAVSVFVLSLLALYTASTMYHASSDPTRKRFLRKLDHCCIYLLIAGTYTPFATLLSGRWGIFLLLTIWALALVGITLKLTGVLKNRWLSTCLYLAMGWLVVFAAQPMLAHFSRQTMIWLLAGGVAYTAGTPFYQSTRISYSHSIWHGFVVLGSSLHFIAVASALSIGVDT
ncbi:PAQR family membrane homeostasis protein TrhA [Xanthomonas arboricola]|uniref:PAQR family membrane homeostasis protein TrhA n=1 Tax=Xanthomonas arboricola TaxID=56448 RepID=UPI0009BA148E|nr:hemolysin III family protein [Xanthomonas arboricola]